jgi:prophage regulatory protein
MHAQSTELHHSAAAFAGATLPASVGVHLPFCYLPIAQVVAAVGLSTSRIYELIKDGEFPAGDLIGKQSRRWKSSDITAWLLAQSAQSEQRQADLAPALKRKADRAASISASKRAGACRRERVMTAIVFRQQLNCIGCESFRKVVGEMTCCNAISFTPSVPENPDCYEPSFRSTPRLIVIRADDGVQL